MIQDAQRRGTIVKTSHDNYKKDAMKILKLRPMPQRSHSLPRVTMPERTLQGSAGPVGSNRKEDSRQKDSSSRQLSVGASTSTEVSHRFPCLPGSHVTTMKVAVPQQMTSAQERPQDPRLARRAPPKQACMENGNSAPSGSGVALPQALDAAPRQGNHSSSIQVISSKAEMSGKPEPAKEAKGLGAGEQHNQPEWKMGQDFVSRSRKASEESLGSEGPVDAKRRRITY